MWRNLASNALTLLGLAMFLLAGLVIWGLDTYKSPGPLAQTFCLKVDPGSNIERVSKELETKRAISQGWIFRAGASYTNRARDLKAGAYAIEPGVSMAQIMDTITLGGASTCGAEVVYRVGIASLSVQIGERDPATRRFVEQASFSLADKEPPQLYAQLRSQSGTRYRVALAEGITSWQVVQGLNAIDILQGALPDIPPEGSLAPDSYEITPGETRAQIVAKMQSAQQILVAAAWEGRDPQIPITTPQELVTLASIIDKETGVADERGVIAGVFANRLRQGMRLQTDPTVIYGVTRGQGTLGRGLRRSELRQATPWNTYVIDGLPPTPIANPGFAALKAAANPATTPYLYFVAQGDGAHAFAATLSEHNRNVAKWRQIEAERARQNN